MAADTLLVLVLAGLVRLLGGSNQISNFYFLSSGIFFVVAVIPIFFEMGGNLRVAGKAMRGDDTEDLAKSQAERSKAGARRTYLFGLAGITTFILALVFV